jgi:hypothetical protein
MVLMAKRLKSPFSIYVPMRLMFGKLKQRILLAGKQAVIVGLNCCGV